MLSEQDWKVKKWLSCQLVLCDRRHSQKVVTQQVFFLLSFNNVAIVGEKKCGLFVRNICLSGRGCACSRCYST